MQNHSKSLFLSLSIHALILLGLLGLYKYKFSSVTPASKEKKICIHLKCIQEKALNSQKTKIQKKIIPSPKKVIKKVVVRKKKIIKRTKVVKKPKIIRKPKPVHKLVHKKIPLKKIVKKEKPEVIEKAVVISEPDVNLKSTIKNTEPVKETLQIKETILQVAQNEAPKRKTSNKEQYLTENLTKISELIKENLYYPRTARKRGIEGSVIVRFILHTDATVTQITTISSSSGILTRAAIKTIAELSGKFPKPSTELTLSVPITYSLH
ncbi:energy transducer TonB [Sulfurimonas sp.]